MKRSKVLVPLMGGAVLAVALSGCAASESAAPAADSSTEATASEEDTSSEGTDPAPDPAAGATDPAESGDPASADTSEPTGPAAGTLDSLAKVQAAVRNYQNKENEAGGVSFLLSDTSGSNSSVFKENADGSGVRESNYDTGATELYFWDPEQHWTQIAYLNDEMKDLAKQVDGKAKYYLEPTGTFTIAAAPDRILLSLLAYSTGASCSDNADGSALCTLTVEGMSTIPGMGGFDMPAENNTADVSIGKDGEITQIVLFPGDKDLERKMTDIAFVKNTIDFPSEGETVTLDELSKQAILNDEANQQEADANGVLTPETSGAGAAGTTAP